MSKSLNESLNGIGIGLDTVWIHYAQQSPHPKHRHATIILVEGKPIAWAYNTHNQHAEARALEMASIYGHNKNIVLISIAITKAGKLKLAKPCRKCQYQIRIRGIKNVYYSTNGQQIVRMKNES